MSVGSQNSNDQNRVEDQRRILKFMTDHKPHVVVLGGVKLSCTWLKDEIYQVCHSDSCFVAILIQTPNVLHILFIGC